MTASKTLGLSCKYLSTHVSTLAVVSWAANITPIMLSAIWESLNNSFLAPNRIPSNPPPPSPLFLLFSINDLNVSFNDFLACFVYCIHNIISKTKTYTSSSKHEMWRHQSCILHHTPEIKYQIYNNKKLWDVVHVYNLPAARQNKIEISIIWFDVKA